MILESLELKNFRNYKQESCLFDPGINLLYGNNAQGKTNVLEAIQLCATTRSPRGARDAEMIRFGEEEAHARLQYQKNERQHRIDIHLRSHGKKGAAIDSIPARRAAEILGQIPVVSFFPEDLRMIKQGPKERRRFLDSQLCQLDPLYTDHLAQYNRALLQRNAALRDSRFSKKLASVLDVWDEQLVRHGSELIRRRQTFLAALSFIVRDTHAAITGKTEQLQIEYEPDVPAEEMAARLAQNRMRDRKWKVTTTGPHRDDFRVRANDIDLRQYGSQGQQRSAALSVKLAELELVKQRAAETPILLLDDVLSELDRERQERLLQETQTTQTILTCTGMEDVLAHDFPIQKIFHVENGTITEKA